MTDTFSIPADCELAPLDRYEAVAVRHKASERVASITAAIKPRQAEVDYLVGKLRRDYRRDRLFAAVGRDISTFRAKQAELRQRGFVI